MAWTLASLVRAAGIDAEIRADAPVAGLSYDSRKVASGDLFCCVRGRQADGHAYASEAVRAGAGALLVERWLELDAPQALTGHVRPVLGPVAATFHGHPSASMVVAAVTGTNGKTTITYLLESIAASAGLNPGVIGSISRRFAGFSEPASRTTPEAIDLQDLLARMKQAGVRFVALEATSDGLASDRLESTRIASAGFTNLTQDHLITHGSMEDYFAAKASLFDQAYTERAVINVDDPFGRQLASSAATHLEVLTYGLEADGRSVADIAPDGLAVAESGSVFDCRTPAGSLRIETQLVGRYNVSNCLGAVGLSLHCGIDPAHIAEGIARLDSMPGRLERVDAGQSFTILVDYAHTPDALAQALGACRELTDKRVIVVFGCGGDRDRTKRPQMGRVATRLSDLAFITSDNPRTEDPAAIVSEIEAGAATGGGTYRSIVDRREAIAGALSEAEPGDLVLIAGKGHEQGQQLGNETIEFDDRVVARDLLGSGEGSCV